MNVVNIAALRPGWLRPDMERSRRIPSGDGCGGFFQWNRIAASAGANERSEKLRPATWGGGDPRACGAVFGGVPKAGIEKGGLPRGRSPLGCVFCILFGAYQKG